MSDALHLAPVSALRAPALTRPAAGNTAAESRAAARSFEAVFVGQMIKPMFATLDAAPPFGGGFAEEVWRDVLADEIGKAIVAAGGIGMADAVAGELLRAQEAAVTPRSPAGENGR